MSYYIVIPAPVRHAKIHDGAKLLFGDIAGLCRKEGYCYASNAHLAEIAGCSKRQAERYIAWLEEAGFITREIEDNERRKIYIASASAYPLASTDGPTHDGAGDILITSSTITNTSVGTKRERFSAPTYDDVKSFASEKNLSDLSEQFVDYYTAAGWMMGKRQMKDWRAAYRNWCRNERKFDRGRGVAPVGALMTYQEMLSHAQKNGFAAGSNKHYEAVSQGESKKPLWRVK